MRLVLDLQASQGESANRGIGRYALSLAQSLARQADQHEVWLTLSARFPERIESLRSSFSGLIPDNHIRVFDVPARTAGMKPENNWRAQAAVAVRDAFLSSLGADVFHQSSLFDGLIDDSVTVTDELPSRLSTTCYDLIPLLYPDRYLTDNQIRTAYYRRLEVLRRADLVLSISESSRQEAINLLDISPERVVNISAAADEWFKPIEVDEARRRSLYRKYGLSDDFVLYVAGGMDWRKNVDGLIKSYVLLPPGLRSEHPLVIVGEPGPNERRRLSALGQRNGLRPRELVLPGYVPDDDLVALYNLCALFVFPSLHEGFGLPVLEAMQCGAAAIGSNNSSIPELLGRNDATFDPGQPGEIAQKTMQALTDPDFLRSLRDSGKSQARKFSWEASGSVAWEALASLLDRQPRRVAHVSVAQGRPRLAYVSPLPPSASGIADYSAGLLPELDRYYDITLVSDHSETDAPWLLANFPIRSPDWFDAEAAQFDRILYQMGNSSYHTFMLDLMDRHPGVIVLHDFFLSDLLNFIEGPDHPQAFIRGLYLSHGYKSLLEEKSRGRLHSISIFPANRQIFDAASRVVVHSEFARNLARAWYGDQVADELEVAPFLRPALRLPSRAEARDRLGIPSEDFLACSFGILSTLKMSDRLLDIWLQSEFAAREDCRLVFVGRHVNAAYARQLAAQLEAATAGGSSTNVTITDYVSSATYRDYLAAADVAIQLRSNTRGETSAAIVDCLTAGIPLIANANGSIAELPDNVFVRLNEQLDDADVVSALRRVWQDGGLRSSVSANAKTWTQTFLHPERVAEEYCRIIEDAGYLTPKALQQRAIRSIAQIQPPPAPSLRDLAEVSTCLSRNLPAPRLPTLFVDVSVLAQVNDQTGIQRVTRSILHSVFRAPWLKVRVEPVYLREGHFFHARSFTVGTFELPDPQIPDEPIEVQSGDVLLGLELHLALAGIETLLTSLHAQGVRIYTVVFDLLPILLPKMFPAGMSESFSAWLSSMVKVSDGLIAISKSVAYELHDWIGKNAPARASSLRLGYFHLGSDIQSGIPTNGIPPDVDHVLETLNSAATFLMVGTVEPRKGHAQTLAAFEQLWANGVNANLVIAGRKGWMVDELAEKIQNHPRKDRSLFWFEKASDEFLDMLYAHSSAVLMASEGEGFGLPIIEAALHNVPVILRDLPVFHEVAGDHATYFSGLEPAQLAGAIQRWMEAARQGTAPSSQNIHHLSWDDSARTLMGLLQDPRHPQWISAWDGDHVALGSAIDIRITNSGVTRQLPGEKHDRELA